MHVKNSFIPGLKSEAILFEIGGVLNVAMEENLEMSGVLLVALILIWFNPKLLPKCVNFSNRYYMFSGSLYW